MGSTKARLVLAFSALLASSAVIAQNTAPVQKAVDKPAQIAQAEGASGAASSAGTAGGAASGAAATTTGATIGGVGIGAAAAIAAGVAAAAAAAGSGDSKPAPQH
jgi:hypothetical protein